MTYILLISIYGCAWGVAVLARLVPRRKWRPTGRILVTGTFFNPNWYLSHLTPLARSGVKEVILVIDKPQLPLAAITFSCWPKWLSRLLSRQGARAVWVMLAGLRYRPDLYMGYHLGPGACTALMAGKLMGRPSCYQMTGGVVEVSGGGDGATESIGASLGRPSKLIETMALAVVRQFELVVVRGSKAQAFLAARGIAQSVAVITGSVQNGLPPSGNVRDIHVIFVGRLSRIKQVDQFIAIVSTIRRTMPDVRATIVGDGPLRADLQSCTWQLGLDENVQFFGQRKDVGTLLARSRVFVLTSKSEGLSIAMAEAMCAGVVPVVPDIGELSDLVVNGVNGYLVEPNDINTHAERIVSLLRDDALWARYSCAAIAAARRLCSIDVICEKWHRCLRDTVYQASGCRAEEAARRRT